MFVVLLGLPYAATFTFLSPDLCESGMLCRSDWHQLDALSSTAREEIMRFRYLAAVALMVGAHFGRLARTILKCFLLRLRGSRDIGMCICTSISNEIAYPVQHARSKKQKS